MSYLSFRTTIVLYREGDTPTIEWLETLLTSNKFRVKLMAKDFTEPVFLIEEIGE